MAGLWNHRSRNYWTSFRQASRRVGPVYALAILALIPSTLLADAIVVNQAMRAETIAQYYVEQEGVRLDLEMGLAELQSFRNLLPDEVYQQITGQTRPLVERLEQFFAQDLVLVADDGRPMPGEVLAMEPRRRIERDRISGEPLPGNDEDAETVIFASIYYRFDERPETISFGKREASGVGFVVYHEGIAVNDFRFLAPSQTLKLDWRDPWYSSFDTRSLRRTYFAPMSAFLYVEPYEVRKEIIVRPKDLQEWVDLGLEGRATIPVAIQPELKRRVAEFLRDRQPVVIDGVVAEPELARVNFLERTLTASRVIDPPTELDINAATLGVIFVYQTVEPLPQKVTAEWDLFNDKITQVPAATVDQAGSLPIYLEPDFATLKWENFLKFPKLPTLKAVLPPPNLIENLMFYGRWVLLGITGLVGWRLWRRGSSGNSLTSGVSFSALALLVVTASGFWVGNGARLSDSVATDVVANLLHNVYRAFDYRVEGDIYDVLDKSVSGELLTDVYLETRRGLELENQGGARAKVKQIDLMTMSTRPAQDGGFLADVTWVVGGSVGHWGHLHERRNQYQAELDIRPVGGVWKLVGMDVIQEVRL
ncbi:MAG: hypothetical protein ACR2PZ_21150 [Pseudomonadales bacterium]